MKSLRLLPLLLGVAALTGCGDPAPSTELAPEKPPLDGNKMSQADLDRLHREESEGNTQHTGAPRTQ